MSSQRTFEDRRPFRDTGIRTEIAGEGQQRTKCGPETVQQTPVLLKLNDVGALLGEINAEDSADPRQALDVNVAGELHWLMVICRVSYFSTRRR